MNIRTLFSTLLAAACLCAPLDAFAAPAPAASAAQAMEQAAPAVSAEVQSLVDRAKAALKAGDKEAAYPLLMRLVRETPEDATVNVVLGQVAFDTKRYTQAIMAYERLSMRFPSDVRWRIALARIYDAMGETASAQRELDAARRIEPAISDSVLTSKRSVASRFSVHGRFTGGFGWDSNVNAGPVATRFNLGSWQVSLNGADPEDSWGGFVSGRLEAGWRVDENSPWHLVGDLNFHKRLNFASELSSGREVGWGRVAAGVRRVGTATLLDVRAKGEMSDQSHCNGVGSYGVEGNFIWAVHPNIHLITAASLDRNSYEYGTGRDGNYWWGAQYVRFILGGDRHELTFGLRWLEGDANERRHAWDGWEATANARIKLPYDVELRPFLAYRETEWGGPATALEGYAREDEQWRWGVSATYDWTENVQLEASWQSIRNDSVSPFCAYDRDMFTVSASYRF